MKKYLLFLALLVIPTRAVAQSHQCDATITPNPTIIGNAKIGFCWSGKDNTGAVIAPTAFKVYFGNSTTAVWQGLLQPIGNPNSTGLNYYESPVLNIPAGNNSVKVSVVVPVGEVASLPFPFTETPATAELPLLLRIVK